MKRYLLVSCGLGFVGLACLGVALPGVPTVPFLLVAAACFARSSRRLHEGLLANRVFGPLLRDWQERRTVPPRARVVGIAMIVGVGAVSVRSLGNPYLRVLVILLLCVPVAVLVRARSTPSPGPVPGPEREE